MISQTLHYQPKLVYFDVIINLFVFLFYSVWVPRQCLMPNIRLAWSENGRSRRRKLLSDLLCLPIELRDAEIDKRWRKMTTPSKKWFSRAHGNMIFQVFRRCETKALEQLYEAKDRTRTLMLLAFIDATRLGSVKTFELQNHIIAVLECWDAKGAAGKGLGAEKLSYHPELELIHQGQHERRLKEEALARRYQPGLLQMLTGDIALPSAFTCTQLGFVEYGPSIDRMRAIMESPDVRYWGCGHPRLENTFLWAIIFIEAFYVFRTLFLYPQNLLYITLNGLGAEYFGFPYSRIILAFME